ncbi:MAG: DEAD/DEAH box helicase [Methylococcales symbiont of Hymedesmia sp. n. MRB-2018]|nr:MAG: DEAD/DEAH box helicase [Methylococcales symbiont of Hymedesmia sp. n. MRB-2018]
MMITNKILQKIDDHWAVKAVGDDDFRRSILQSVKAKLVSNAVGEQLTLDPTTHILDDADLKRLAMAYEMAAIEGMHDFINHSNDDLYDQFLAGSFRAFEINRVLNDPDDDFAFIFYVLHLSSLACCGDCWTDLKHIYDDKSEKIESILLRQETEWDKQILLCLFTCWVSLFRKNSWNDLSQISNSINQLRKEQAQYEQEFLKSNSNKENQTKAIRLMALYHWAKASELLSLYMLQGDPADIKSQLDKHFNLAIKISADGGDAQLEVLLRWLHACAEQMINGSIWWVARTINSKATKFIEKLSKQAKPLLELLPPQRAALKEMNLLDPAKTAVVVDMPTSGGKTLLAQFKILQAINNFGETKGWVAYIAPTKALVSQITRQLRQDFSPIGIKVEKLSGAIEVDALEEDMLNDEASFDILVSTPEKMQLVLRNHKIKRPLSLLVMDEAHNIEDESRGLRIELLLATVKQHYQAKANFLLLMPYVENAQTLSRWLAHDRNAGLSISLSTSPWKPNERIIGLVTKQKGKKRGDWSIKYKTLITSPKTIHLKGKHKIGVTKPINDVTYSSANLSKLVAACAKNFANRGTSIVVVKTKPNTWSVAKTIFENIDPFENISTNIKLVQNYLKDEVGVEFELIKMLDKGIGIHNSGLSDEIKSLMEWLTEEGELRVLCATTTIAQGINFPVSSIFLQSIEYPYGKKMSYREFWNLVGRAGRIGQDNIGVVGIACDSDEKEKELTHFVQQSTGDLISRLIGILKELDNRGELNNLESMMYAPQWEDFRCYIAHLLNEKKELQATINEMDQMLTNTFGYSELKNTNQNHSEILLEATKQYTQSIAKNMGRVAQADMTGFSVESVKKAAQEIDQLKYKLTTSDWMPQSLFSSTDSKLPDLFSVMFKIEQLNFSHDDTQGRKKSRMADIAKAWIDGKTINEIAISFFEGNDSKKISEVYNAIYSKLANGGTWGLSALASISGLDFEAMSDEQKRQLNLMPAMLYHGVNNEESVLMRMNSVPRSIADSIGNNFKQRTEKRNIATARKYLKSLRNEDWAIYKSNFLTGSEYKKIWQILSGELD